MNEVDDENEISSKTVTMIVAASENDIIGNDGDMPWRLSRDLRRFKQLTMGHTIIMGRKTFDSIGRLLPGRKTVILTRQKELSTKAAEGAIVVNRIEDAFLATDDQSPFVVGGAEIYYLAMPFIDEIQLTRVHADIAGDTALPEINWKQWKVVSEERFSADEKNSHTVSFLHFRRA